MISLLLHISSTLLFFCFALAPLAVPFKTNLSSLYRERKNNIERERESERGRERERESLPPVHI